MELQENSIIVSDRLDGIFDAELKNYFTHAYCTAGECEVVYNNERFTITKGDCVIIIANQLVSAIHPADGFQVKVIYIEVGYYADQLCVTPKYLSEVCRKVSGYAANFWINRYATIDIARLLKDKSLSFTEISDMYGFTSQSHFSRYVQQNLGASPSVFRE